MKHKLLSSLLRWGLVFAILFFIGRTVNDNWQAVSRIQVPSQAWFYAVAALGVALLSHLWLAVLWGWILRNLRHPVPWHWSLGTYLTIDIFKYLPGNVWHLYGLVRAAQKVGIPVEVGTTSVILDPLFMTAAGMGFSLLNSSQRLIQGICGFGLVCILIGIYPPAFDAILRWLRRLGNNPIGHQISRWINQRRKKRPQSVRLRRYPLGILLGEFLLIGLRCICFLLSVSTFTSLSGKAIAPIIGGFSFAWMLGLVIPGFPGGLGIFEAAAIALLGELLPPGLLLGAIALYRLITISAEVIGVGLGWLVKGQKLPTGYNQ